MHYTATKCHHFASQRSLHSPSRDASRSAHLGWDFSSWRKEALALLFYYLAPPLESRPAHLSRWGPNLILVLSFSLIFISLLYAMSWVNTAEHGLSLRSVNLNVTSSHIELSPHICRVLTLLYPVQMITPMLICFHTRSKSTYKS